MADCISQNPKSDRQDLRDLRINVVCPWHYIHPRESEEGSFDSFAGIKIAEKIIPSSKKEKKPRLYHCSRTPIMGLQIIHKIRHSKTKPFQQYFSM